MDAFDDAFGGEGGVEVDPAAEFLAKEQEELADLGEDLGFAAPQQVLCTRQCFLAADPAKVLNWILQRKKMSGS
jgi:hypothetical protein